MKEDAATRGQGDAVIGLVFLRVAVSPRLRVRFHPSSLIPVFLFPFFATHE
jgi:hypothetical protein